jgi:hypothetical protein
VRPPIAFIYGNCVFGEGMADGWAAFTVTLNSYRWLGGEEKHAQFLALLGALEAAEADVQILRVSARWDLDAYRSERLDAVAPGGLRADEHSRYVEDQVEGLRDTWSGRPQLYLLVSLSEPELDVASYLSRLAAQRPGEVWTGLRRAIAGRRRPRARQGQSRPGACAAR